MAGRLAIVLPRLFALPCLLLLVAGDLADDEEIHQKVRVALKDECEADDALCAKLDQLTPADMKSVLVAMQDEENETGGGSSLTYEEPRDQIPEGVKEWFLGQQWRYFTSEVGRPGSRSVTDVGISYVTARGGEGAGSKGAVLISIGQGSACEFEAENAHRLIAKGYSPIYCITHRGQGRSGRLLDNHFKNHVEESADFIIDFRTFVNLTLEEMAANEGDRDKPVFLLCHSMGCAISLTYVIEEYEAQRPQQFHAVAATVPLIKADTRPFSYGVAVAIGEIMWGLGQSENYAPTKERTYEESHGEQAFEGSSTTSLSRWTLLKSYCHDSRNSHVGTDEHIGLCTGGLTAGMAKEFFDLYSDTFEGFMVQEGKKIAPPLRIMQAGPRDGTDNLVQNPYQDRFCTSSCSSCTLTRYPHARHSIMREVDSIYLPYLDEVDGFFQNHSGSLVEQNPIPDNFKRIGERCSNDLECNTRFCDANFLLDSFGGVCQPQEIGVSGAPLAHAGCPVLLAASLLFLLFR